MRKLLAGQSLKNLVHSKKNRKAGNFMNWHDAKQLTLILEQEDKTSRSEIDNFLNQLDKHIEVLYIESGVKTPSYSDWTCYTKKDFNLLALPKKKIVQDLHKLRSDLVINTTMNHAAFSAALASSIPCSCVCSANDHYGHGDLHIKRRTDQPLIDYLRQVIHYLKMIRPN